MSNLEANRLELRSDLAELKRLAGWLKAQAQQELSADHISGCRRGHDRDRHRQSRGIPASVGEAGHQRREALQRLAEGVAQADIARTYGGLLKR